MHVSRVPPIPVLWCKRVTSLRVTGMFFSYDRSPDPERSGVRTEAPLWKYYH